MLNRIILIGRVTRDAELRYTASGTAVSHFSLAVDRDFKTPDGEKQTDFLDVVAWRKLAETTNEYLLKGRLVSVEGRLQIHSWEAQDGSRRKAAEVIADNIRYLDSKAKAEAAHAEAVAAAAEAPADAEPEAVPF